MDDAMRGFDLEQLHTFVAVVDAGSLSAAAPRVFLSQSSVSEQIRKLEQRAGAQLLSRGKRGVATTEAGERLLLHARQLLALSEAAYAELRGEGLQGALRLAITDYFRPGEVPRLLQGLSRRYPRLRVSVTIAQSDAIEQGCRAGAFDIGLVMRAGARRGGAVLRREPLLWAAAAGSKLAQQRPLPLVLLPPSCELHRLARRLLSRQHTPYQVAHSASGVAGLQGALAAGLGVGCINESALTPELARLGPRERLPALPQAEFQLLPPRRDEAPLLAQAREMLAAQLL
jgi:DNA-binding transcriptional LysR family regulator